MNEHEAAPADETVITPSDSNPEDKTIISQEDAGGLRLPGEGAAACAQLSGPAQWIRVSPSASRPDFRVIRGARSHLETLDEAKAEAATTDG